MLNACLKSMPFVLLVTAQVYLEVMGSKHACSRSFTPYISPPSSEWVPGRSLGVVRRAK